AAAAWLGGRMLLRAVAAQALGVDRSTVAWEVRPNGALALVGVPHAGVSLARSEGVAVAAVCSEGIVGVDVEASVRFGGDSAAARVWCVREAVSKASGCGLDAALSIEVGGPGPVVDPAGRAWRIVPVDLPEPWSACLAVPVDSVEAVSVVEVRFGTIPP
ncbi:MAG: 4'-phosphopantetheinyl transferase family protein, partial [Armatimonadota bacterium]